MTQSSQLRTCGSVAREYNSLLKKVSGRQITNDDLEGTLVSLDFLVMKK